jgi:hypothetical protein
MGSLISWLFTGGATAIFSTAGNIANKIGAPLAEAYAAKQKAMVDQHGMDVNAATQITLGGYQSDTRTGELYAAQALADSTNEKNSWMRKIAFLIAAFVLACVAIESTLPKLAAAIGIDTSHMVPIWMYLFIGIITAIVGLRPLEKASTTKSITKMQATIAEAAPSAKLPSGLFGGRGAIDKAGAPGTG